MDTIFMNSGSSKASDHHRQLLNFLDKINLKRKDKYTALSSLSIYNTQKNRKNSYLKRHEKLTDNLSIRIYINKIENSITVSIKTGYYLEFLTPETTKLLRSTKSKITKDKNGKNVSHLKTTEVVLVHCNIVNNDYQQDSRILYTFVPNKSYGQ